MRILLMVHGFPPGACGGTELYVRDFARALAAAVGDEVFVLTREADVRRRELSVRRHQDGFVTVFSINNTFQACTSFEESYSNPGLRRVGAAVLAEVMPDVVHVQHLTCLSTGLLEDIARLDIPVVMTLNDYWLICHRGQLLDLREHRCPGPFEGGCDRCLPEGALAGPASYRAGRIARSLRVPGAHLAVSVATKAAHAVTGSARRRAATLARLRHMQEAVSHVRQFLAPSDTLAEKFRQFGIGPDRLTRCDQGIDLRPFRGLERSPSPMLRVAFAGSFIPSKGPHVLLDAASRLPPGSIAVDLLGARASYHGESDYGRTLERWLTHPVVRRLGTVPHERIAASLRDVDVIVVPSIWIENAPFIIREAFASGAPVIASDLGGMAEMVRHDVDGLLFSPGDASALAAQLRRFGEEPRLLERLRGGIRAPMSIEEDAARVRRVYAGLAAPRGDRAVAPAAGAPSAVRPARRTNPGRRAMVSLPPAGGSHTISLAAVVLNYRTADQTTLAVRSLQSAFDPPAAVFVVDNGSGDGSCAALRASLGGVEILDAGRNLGFSGGCNIGVRAALEAGAEYVLLMNSDAVAAPDAIGHLVDVLRNDAAVGIVGPVLLAREEPDRIASAGISFSTRTGRMRHRAAGLPVSLLPPVRMWPVDAVSGCTMLVKRAVFERAGLFDEAYFFSFEDIDFCLRARAAGFRTACVQDAIVYHEGGRSIGRRSAARVYYATRNHLRLTSTAGSILGREWRRAVVVGLNAAYVVVAPEAPLVAGLAAVARGAWHHIRGRYGPS